MKSPKVWIVVLNYNGADDTLQCIESIYKLDYDNFDVIVLDNHSKDNSEQVIESFKRTHPEYPFVFKETGKNGGYAAGNNIGIRYAIQYPDTAYVWILNNDTLVTPNSLRLMINKMETDPRIGICGSKLVYSWDRSRVQAYGGKYNPVTGISRYVKDRTKLHEIDHVIGASTLVSRNFLEVVGLICEDYFLYTEEIDWALRAKNKFKVSCSIDSVVYHKEGASIGLDHGKGTGEISDLGFYYSVRNRLLLSRKFYPYFYPLVLLRMVYTLLHTFARGNFRRSRMIFNLMLGRKDARFEGVRER